MTAAPLKAHWRKYKLRYYLLFLFLLGVTGVLAWGPNAPWHVSFIEHLFMAVAVAAFIAFFMEVALHQEFARNVFEAAIGYVLPKELRDELRWIYDQKFLCERHVQTVTITRIDAARVRVNISFARTFRNITAETQPIHPGIGLNEWFHPDLPSEIVNVSAHLDGEPVGENLATKIYRKQGDITVGKLAPLMVPSHGKATISVTTNETLHENDWTYSHFGAPTSNVTVTVNAPVDLDVEVRFSHRTSDPKFTKTGLNVWQLSGVLLPLQGIRVYWRRKDLFEAWKQTLNEEPA